MKEKICVKKFSCERDSIRLQGRMYFPKSSDVEKLKPVIISHGFMSSRKMCRSYAEIFARWGYAAFIFGYNDVKPDGMTVLGATEDLHSVVRFVQSLDFVDSSELALMGLSQGGLVSALLSARLQEQVKKLIMFYPVLCPDDDAEKISTYRGPVCIIHGDSDNLVKLECSEKAIAAYRDEEMKNGGDEKSVLKKQLFVLNGAGHVFNKISDYHAMNIVEQFLSGMCEILEIDVKIKSRTETKENGIRLETTLFKGEAKGPFFSGKIQAGAQDVQQWKGRNPLRLCSNYVIKGPDSSGQRRMLSVSNFSCDGVNWARTIKTDSPVLRELGVEKYCRMVMEYRDCGPLVRLFTMREAGL